TTTHIKDLGSGAEVGRYKERDGGVYRVSSPVGKYLVHRRRIRDRRDGLLVERLVPPKFSDIILVDDESEILVVHDRERGLAYWEPLSDSLEGIKPVFGYLNWFYGDGGKVIVFVESDIKRNSARAFFYATVSDLLANDWTFHYFTVAPGHYPADLSL